MKTVTYALWPLLFVACDEASGSPDAEASSAADGEHEVSEEASTEVVVPASGLRIDAVPTMGLHVELTWGTPGDPDPFDVNEPTDWTSVGSDLDLHFVRGDGGYFGTDDTYFANFQSSWGVGAYEKPRLDRDDTDGMGPENLNLSSFEPGVIYRVGVHYRDDAGFGESFARLRIFIDGALIDDWGGVQLVEGDMWSSHHIMDGRAVRLGDGSSRVSQFEF